MTYYIVKSPTSGRWICAPLEGSSPDRHKAWPYPENHPWLQDMVELALKWGEKMRLRQVLVVEEVAASMASLATVTSNDA